MVRFVANDLETAIDLLQQDDAHHLMGEGHGRKGKFEICPPADCGRQPQRAAYDAVSYTHLDVYKRQELGPAVEFPESFEAGTVNAPGIIGLGAAARLINKIGIEAVVQHERELTERLQNGLRAIEGVTVYGSPSCLEKTAVVACNLEGRSCEEVALALNDRYGIAVRAGLHCSGMAHETMGTQDVGCVRMCPGFYTSEAEIRQALEAVKEIAASK